MNEPDPEIGRDRLGQAAKMGDLVRLLAIRPSILKRLTGSEQTDVSSMLGQTLKVFDVYEGGSVWVSLVWSRDDGSSEVHGAMARAPGGLESCREAEAALARRAEVVANAERIRADRYEGDRERPTGAARAEVPRAEARGREGVEVVTADRARRFESSECQRHGSLESAAAPVVVPAVQL